MKMGQARQYIGRLIYTPDQTGVDSQGLQANINIGQLAVNIDIDPGVITQLDAVLFFQRLQL